MAKYRIENVVVDTANATRSWKEKCRWNGSNRVGRSTGSQWLDQTLFRSRRGRYYLETLSRIQGVSDRAEWVSLQEATRWLLVNEHELPTELEQCADEVSE